MMDFGGEFYTRKEVHTHVPYCGQFPRAARTSDINLLYFCRRIHLKQLVYTIFPYASLVDFFNDYIFLVLLQHYIMKIAKYFGSNSRTVPVSEPYNAMLQI